MNKIAFFLICFLSAGTISAQDNLNSLLVKMLKQQLKDWKENPPADEEDMVINSAQPFIPPDGKFSLEAELGKHMDSVKKRIQVSTGGASLYETETGELRIDYLSLNTDWVNIPCWQDVTIAPNITSVTDSKGKEIILPQKKYEEYAEKGYFSSDMSFGRSFGNIEQKVYLGKEPVNESYPLTLKGEIWVSYPAEYQAFTFTASDTGKPKQMGKYTITLLSMEKNTVLYLVSGPRGFSDEYNKLCTDKNGKPFVSRHGSSTGYEFYKEAKKNNFELSDKRLGEIAAVMEKEAPAIYAGGNTEQLCMEKVPGKFFKITFYKVVSTSEKTFPLELKAGE